MYVRKTLKTVVKNYLQEFTEEWVLKVMARQPKSVTDCILVLQEEWANIPHELIRKLYQTIPRRIAAVRKAKGGHRKY
ncbi:hypothetical protein QE152_g39942 [Popillia japonica]|uniref:Transposase n=1 Tax=Popillia japonica TaxID=7064 RepID=A0AAW1HTD5_POPJA